MPGVANGLLIHEANFGAALVGRYIRIKALMKLNSQNTVNGSIQLNIGGMAIEYVPFQNQGQRVHRFDLDMFVNTTNSALGGACQGQAAIGQGVPLTYFDGVSRAGAVATQNIQFLLKGAFTGVQVLLCSIEML